MTAATIRPARASDTDAVADLFVRSRHDAVPDVPPLAVPDDDARDWIAGAVRNRGEVWVAELDGGPVGLMVLQDDWLDQLYVDPSWTGLGIGGALVDCAKRRRPGGLQLWTFQSNRRAHRFYERHGFVEAERTDRSANQERAADVRYVWRPGLSAPAAAP